ncbi:BGTF surface domain-containing protein [Haloarcula sp. H-GB4]|uniref:BGTF surface domain-containing protein n=1 Tax=Haloarcula sp. H-GB4 TaxID=3069755 RepID=UPI00359CA2C4
MSLRSVVLAAVLIAAAVTGPGLAAAEQQATVSEDSLPLHADEQQVVTGETTLEAGTEMTVKIVSENSSNPFIYRRQVTVQPNGTFVAQFDLSRHPANISYDLSAYADGDRLFNRTETIAPCDDNCTDPEAAATEQQATVSEDSLPLHADQQQVVTGETTLEPGTEMTVEIVSENSSNPFLYQRQVIVQPNGTFAAQFDLSRHPANTSYELSAHVDGDWLFERTETIAPCDGNCTDPVPEIETPEPTDDGGNVVEVAQGDTAEIPVSMTDGGTKTLSIGSEAANYRINATVSDDDGDGEVLVLFDTAVAGTDGATLSVADDGDSLTVTESEPDLSSTLAAAAYSYRVFDGQSTDGRPTVGTIVIEANGTTSEQFEVEESADFGLEETVVQGRQGETARIQIALATADAATISIGSPEVNYEINATVRDGNDDDRVALLFDTTAAGHDEPTLETAADADAVSVESGSEVALDSQLDVGTYELSLYRGTEVAERQPDTVGSLRITDGNTTSADAASDDADSVTGETPAAQQSQAGDFGISVGALVVGGVLAIVGVGVGLRSVMN